MNIFINDRLKINGEEWIPEKQEFFDDVIINLVKILDAFKYYADVIVYYSSESMKILVENLQQINGLINGNYEAKINLIRALINEINAKDWVKSKRQRNDMIYFYQESLGEKTNNISNTTLAEGAEFKFLGSLVAIINLKHSEYNDSVPIYINRSSINPPKEMQMLVLDAFSSKKELLNYIVENRIPRIYNHNPKHGENGNRVKANKNEEVSPLESSIEEARDLLKYAVSIKRKNELYVYDVVRTKFMVYKAETTNIYHAYHPINQNEVPQQVKDFLNMVD